MPFYNRLVKLICTFFYVGYLPLIPGTFGSLAGLGLYYLLKENTCLYISVTLFLAFLGFLLSGSAEKIFNKKDPKYVVIDEVTGMLFALMFLPFDLKFVISGFFIFRLLDTLKPYPAGRLQKIKGGFGIMIDDILAALYTNIILQVIFATIF